MHTAVSPADPPPLVVAPRVMLLSVWGDAGQRWLARVVMPDARVHEFDSPFALARFLAQP